MHYAARLSPAEEEFLSRLNGQTLRAVRDDGWSLEVESSGALLQVVPEEIATPDELHPGAVVDRPRISLIPESRLGGRSLLQPDSFGLVHSVNVLSVLITFTPPQRDPPMKLLDKAWIPEHASYGWMYFRSEDKKFVQKEIDNNDIALIDLDIGFELTAEKGPAVVIYTRGFFACASVTGLPNEEWVSIRRYCRRELPLVGGA